MLYELDIKLSPERQELLEGGWEGKRIQAMLDDINPGDVVIDVGTEEGDISALLAMKGAQMVLIEPSPTMWPHIKENFENNKLKAFICFEGFASNKTDGEVTTGWPTSANDVALNVRSFRHLNEETSITKQLKIDDLALTPKLITIDVEGSEYEVIEGAMETLKRGTILYTSLHDDLMWLRYKHWPHDLRHMLFGIGYEPTLLCGWDHELHIKWEKVR